MLKMQLSNLKKDSYVWLFKSLIAFTVAIILTMYAVQEWISAPEFELDCYCMVFIIENLLAPLSLWIMASLLIVKTRTLRNNWKNINNSYRELRKSHSKSHGV
jgi:hypothetical protein